MQTSPPQRLMVRCHVPSHSASVLLSHERSVAAAAIEPPKKKRNRSKGGSQGSRGGGDPPKKGGAGGGKGGKGGGAGGNGGGGGVNKKLKNKTASGKPICYKYNNKEETCLGVCDRAHVCQLCLKDHPRYECPN